MLPHARRPSDRMPPQPAHGGRSPWLLAVLVVLSVSLVTLGPTSFPHVVDAACPTPEFMRDSDGDCMARGTLIVMTGESSGGKSRADLERAIEPLGGRIETAVDVAGIYGVLFPAADTLAELDEREAALEASGSAAHTLWNCSPRPEPRAPAWGIHAAARPAGPNRSPRDRRHLPV